MKYKGLIQEGDKVIDSFTPQDCVSLNRCADLLDAGYKAEDHALFWWVRYYDRQHATWYWGVMDDGTKNEFISTQTCIPCPTTTVLLNWMPKSVKYGDDGKRGELAVYAMDDAGGGMWCAGYVNGSRAMAEYISIDRRTADAVALLALKHLESKPHAEV